AQETLPAPERRAARPNQSLRLRGATAGPQTARSAIAARRPAPPLAKPEPDLVRHSMKGRQIRRNQILTHLTSGARPGLAPTFRRTARRRGL
ncbi:MAG: hypothetical protein WB647_01405, partial [Roseiarcus sp.]|uniref:hypothetical protein n=1 Tax=Roseiarcus sp. TaxID=1969460 RepID=UPI003C62355B